MPDEAWAWLLAYLQRVVVVAVAAGILLPLAWSSRIIRLGRARKGDRQA